MEYNISDEILTSFSFDIVGSLRYEDEARINDPAYDQVAPQSPYPDPEQNNSTPGSVFGPYLQDQSTMSGYDPCGVESFPRSLEDLIAEWAQGNSVLVGAANQHNDPWNHLEAAGLNSHYQQTRSPMGESPIQSTPDGSLVDQPTTSSSHSSADKEGTADRIKCGWGGCTSQDLYGRDLSLWRHIRNAHILPSSLKCSAPQGGESLECEWEGCESQRHYGHHSCLWRHIKDKHILSKIFKCPTPQCGKSFGRKDKMLEHQRCDLRGRHANAEARQEGHPPS